MMPIIVAFRLSLKERLFVAPLIIEDVVVAQPKMKVVYVTTDAT